MPETHGAVLVVDDDPAFVKLLEEALTPRGYRVLGESSARLAAMRATGPDGAPAGA